jgi:hypothetical protein
MFQARVVDPYTIYAGYDILTSYDKLSEIIQNWSAVIIISINSMKGYFFLDLM